MKRNRDLIIGLILDAIALSGRLDMEFSLVLVLAAWVVSIYGVYIDDAPNETVARRVTQSIAISGGAILLAWWIYVPQPQLVGTLTTTGTATYRTVEFGDSGAILFDTPQDPDQTFAYLSQNQALEIDIIHGKSVVTTKVLDKDGNLLAEVNRNVWRIPDPSRIDGWNYTKDALEVIGPSDRVVLQVRLLPDRLQLQGEWWSESGRGIRMVGDPDRIKGGEWVLLSREGDPDEPHIRRLFQYPNKEHLGQFARDSSREFQSERVMYVAAIIYCAYLSRSDTTAAFLACLATLFRRFDVRPTLSRSTRTRCLSASWNVTGYSEIGFAFGVPYLDCGHNRGANGLSGIGDPIMALPEVPQWQELGVQTHDPADGPEWLLLPQPANARDRMSISAIRLSVSRKSPFAGTVIDIDRPCPQPGD